MGYFPNGTSGDIYEAQYCARCIHRDEEKGCPVMTAHMLYAYSGGEEAKHILNMLIPEHKTECRNEQCRLFHEGVPPAEIEAAIARDSAMPLGDAQQAWLERQMKKGVTV